LKQELYKKMCLPQDLPPYPFLATKPMRSVKSHLSPIWNKGVDELYMEDDAVFNCHVLEGDWKIRNELDHKSSRSRE
jgi:hypothetical protein